MTDPLPDGTYDVLVVDISVDSSSVESTVANGEGHQVERPIAIELVVTAGPEKGQVATVEFNAPVNEEDAVSALGLPGTLTVEGGQPQLQLDDQPTQ